MEMVRVKVEFHVVKTMGLDGFCDEIRCELGAPRMN